MHVNELSDEDLACVVMQVEKSLTYDPLSIFNRERYTYFKDLDHILRLTLSQL